MKLFCRYHSTSSGEREIQRTMLELLNQLDGFDSRGDVKVGVLLYSTGVLWLFSYVCLQLLSRGRNNGRSSVNFRAFFKMTAHFSTCSVRVTDHVRIIAQLV